MTIINNVGINSLAFNIVGVTNNSAFYNTGMHIYGILHFSCANAVSAYVEHVIYPARNSIKSALIP